ncbi:MAG: CapA family protein [Actinomycetota bacterium]
MWERAAAYASQGERFDFRPMFAKIKPIISRADLGICHMETPLDADDRNLSSYPVFSVPHELADAVAWAGYDGCSTASNHALDQGTSGVKATLAALDRAGVDHAGTARTKKEAQSITMLDVNGVKVAHLSYTYGFNGFTPDVPWRANKIKVADIISTARLAKEEGADFVIVSLHWGTEYVQQPVDYQRKVAGKVLGSPVVDLILGHHAHVVQPIDRIGDKFVVYGMGNLVSGMTASLGKGPVVQDGVIVQVSVSEEGRDFVVDEVTFTPTWVQEGAWRIVPALSKSGGALQQSFRRTSKTILSLHAKGVRPDR